MPLFFVREVLLNTRASEGSPPRDAARGNLGCSTSDWFHTEADCSLMLLLNTKKLFS